MPTITFKSKDEIPEGLGEFAKEAEGGAFVVNVAPAEKLTEFRDNNIKLAKERDGLVERVKKYSTVIGEDFDAFQERFSQLTELEKQAQDKKLIDEEGFEKAVNERTEKMRQDAESRMKALEAERDKYANAAKQNETQLHRQIVTNSVTSAALSNEVNALPEAVSDILARAERTFHVEDGKMVPRNENGEIIYGPDAANPMSVKEWLASLRESAPYLFKGSNGGGANGGTEAAPSRGAVKSKADLTTVEAKTAFIRKHGLAAFENLPIRA